MRRPLVRRLCVCYSKGEDMEGGVLTLERKEIRTRESA